jgi:hypothetical protein
MIQQRAQRDLSFVVIAMVVILVGPLQETAMSDDGAPDGLSAVSLWTPGVVITHETKPFEEFTIYSVYLGAGRRPHTVKAYLGQNVEDSGIHTFDPVDWESAVVPRGAQLFSVTAGVSAETVTQFWVGWIKDRSAYLEALTEQHAIKATLAVDESVVFPAVMDGAGAASLFSWRAGAHGASLWQTVFKGTTASPHSVVESPGPALISRAAAVPGHPRRALVAWVEHAETTSVLGMALVEHGQATVWRSDPIAGMAPVREQRIGVWASEDGRLETSVVLAGEGEGGPGYRLARFSARRGGAKGALKSEKVAMRSGEIASAAIEYASSLSDPEHVAYFLTRDGRLLQGRGLRVVRRSVPSDSPLPIVEGYWVSKMPDGRPQFERLGGP